MDTDNQVGKRYEKEYKQLKRDLSYLEEVIQASDSDYLPYTVDARDIIDSFSTGVLDD